MATFDELKAAIEAQQKPAATPTTAPPSPLAQAIRRQDEEKAATEARFRAAAPLAPKPEVAARKPAQPRSPTVTRKAEAVPSLPEKSQAPPPLVMPPELKRVVDYEAFFSSASIPTYRGAVRSAARDAGMSEPDYEKLAEAQGVSLQSLFDARQKGRAYFEVARANRDRGVLGFLPVYEREAVFRRTADAVENARRGIASDSIELKQAGADRGIAGAAGGAAAGAMIGAAGGLPGAAIGAAVGGLAGARGYAAAGTSEVLPEVSKPGEYGYTTSSMLVDALRRDKEASRIYDLYGRRASTGATQKYVEARVADLVKRSGLGPTVGAEEKLAKFRRQAINEVLAYKTIGQWTPAITVRDTQVTEGKAAPGFFDALTPNIELIGVNNKGQAVFRQESPLGVLFRAIDIPQAALSGKLQGLTAAEGVQTGANLLEVMMDSTEGAAPYIRYPALAAGFVASAAFPDLLAGIGAAEKGIQGAASAYKLRKALPQVSGLLETVARSRAAKDFAAATKAEAELRQLFPVVADNLDRYDASAAKMLRLVDPKTDILSDDLAALIGSRIPAAQAEAASRSWMHPSMRKDVLSAKTPTKDVPFTAYDELYDTKRLLGRVTAAREDYVRNGPQTIDDYVAMYTKGIVRDVVSGMAPTARPDKMDVDRLAEIVAKESSLAPTDMSKFLDNVQAALVADAEFGKDEYEKVRRAMHTPGTGRLSDRLTQKLRGIAGKSPQELQVDDIALFDRAIKSIETNNEARGLAATLLREELAKKARIRVEPLNVFDDVAPVGADGAPLKLSAAGTLFLHALRRADPEADLQDLMRTAAVVDQMVIGRAARERRDPLDLYHETFPEIRRATPEDIEKYAPPTPPAAPSAPPTVAPAAPAAVEEAAEKIVRPTSEAPIPAKGRLLPTALAWAPTLPEGAQTRDVAEVKAAVKLLEDAAKGASPGVTAASFARADGTVGAHVIAVGDVRIVVGAATDGEPFNVVVVVGSDTMIMPKKPADLKAAQKYGIAEAKKMMEARAAKGEPAIKGAMSVPSPAAQNAADKAREYLRANPDAKLKDVQKQFGISFKKLREVHAEVKAERVADTERIAQLEGELEQAVQSGDEFRQGELEMEIENLRRMAEPEAAPRPVVVEEVAEAPAAVAAAPAKKLSTSALQREGKIGYNKAKAIKDRVVAGELTEEQAFEEARRLGATTPTSARPAAPTPITAAIEAPAEAERITEAAPKVPTPLAKPEGGTWLEYFRETIKPEAPSDALRAVAKRVARLYEDVDFAQNLAIREATTRLVGMEPEEILSAPPEEMDRLLAALDVDGGVSEFDLQGYVSPSDMIGLTPNEALELGGFPAGTKASDLTPTILDDLIERVTEIAGEVGRAEKLEPRLREAGGGSVESLADVRYDAPELQDRIVPIEKDDAFAFVKKHHSKLPRPRASGLVEAIGVSAGGDLRVVGLLNTPSGGYANPFGIVELSRVASDGKLKGGASAVTLWAMENFQRFNRTGDPAQGRFVTTSLLSERGEVYAALEPQGLHPTSLVKPSEGTGSRAGAKGTARKGEWKINWEFGPAAAPARPHLYHIQPIYRDVVTDGKKLTVKRLNSLVQREGTDPVAAYEDAAHVLGVSMKEEPALVEASRKAARATPEARQVLADNLRHMLLEKFNSKTVADADRVEQAKLRAKALRAAEAAEQEAELAYQAARNQAKTRLIAEAEKQPPLFEAPKPEAAPAPGAEVAPEVKPVVEAMAETEKKFAETPITTEATPNLFPSIERDAQRADINRAAKKRQADVIIARLYGDDLAAEYEEIPSTFRVAAAQRLRKAEEGLAAGKITQEQFNKLVEGVSADLSDQAQIRRTRAAMADRRRGADWVRSRLLAAKSDGVLDEAGVDLADWFIQQNPSIADDLAVSVRKGSEFSSTAGFYEATNRVVTLFKERGGELTATHEVLHHTERMLPDALRTAIREEWSKRLTAAIKTATPEQRPLLTAMLAGSDRERVMKAFEDGEIPLAFYQFANPSEFWAVNASSIVAGRYAASNKGLGAKAKRWLTEFAQKAKSIFGLQSDAPLIRGLDAVLKGDGTFVSKEMLSQGDIYGSMEARANALRYSLPQEQRPVAATLFSGGGLVEAGLQNVVRPGYAVEARGDIAAHYGKVFGEHVENVDVRSVDFKRLADKNIGYLHASPVCKNFSAAKAVNAAGEQALDIETAAATARAINEVKPPVFTLENVANYMDSAALRLIEDALRRNGYTFDKNVFNAADYGAATSRKRLLLRAVREGELPPLPAKTGPSDWYTRVEDLVDDLPASSVPPWIEARLRAAGIDWRNVDRPLMVAGGSAGTNVPYAFAGGPTFTIKATPKETHRIIMPGGVVKKAAPRALARITGLPDDYPLPTSFETAVTIIGNGVPLELTDSVFAPLIESRYAQPGRAPVSVAAEAPMLSGISATRAAQTETPEFKRWFGDSKVVDAEGKPLVVYHGTSGPGFDSFDKERIGSANMPGWFGSGFYVTDSRGYAEGIYARGPKVTPAPGFETGGSGGVVAPLHVRLKRPFVFGPDDGNINLLDAGVRLPEEIHDAVLARAGFDSDVRRGLRPLTGPRVPVPQAQARIADALREELLSRGYDGVIADLPAVPGAREIVVFDPTQVKSATSNVGTFSPTDPSILKQVSPSGAVKGVTETLADGRNIIILFEGADTSTILHEVAHIVRKTSLNNDDMEAITSWIRQSGVNVSHEYGEFVGGADEVEQAEELFAKAFERYVAEGKAPSPRLASAFEHLKNTILNIYRGVRDPVLGVQLQPEVRAVFDRLLADVPEQPMPTLKQALRREILGVQDDEFGFLKRLSQEAQRKGIPDSTSDDIQRQFDAAAKGKRASNQTYISFAAPVFGKKDWSLDDLMDAQARREVERGIAEARKKGLKIDITGRGAKSGAIVEEDTPIERLRAGLAEPGDRKGPPSPGRAALRSVAATFFGGDVVREKGGAANALRQSPPELRKAIDTAERLIEQAIGDTVSLVNDAIVYKDSAPLLEYLSGESRIRRKAGRPILSAGHDFMGSVNGMVRRAIESMSEPEQAALMKLADAVNAPSPSEALARLGFNPDGSAFETADAVARATREAANSAMNKLLYATGKASESDFGSSLAQALRGAVQASPVPRPTHEMKFVETLTYVSGLTARDGSTFSGTSYDATETLLSGVEAIYDEESKRRVAVVIGGFGSASVGKTALVKLELGISEDAKRAFANWLAGEQWPAEYSEEIQRIVDRYGYNPEFTRDAVLDTNYYIPRLARERMAEALTRATYRPDSASNAGDAFSLVYRFMKTRMTRGNLFLRQRYFMMNTIDHFVQLGMTAGFGVAASSVTRVLAQDLMVLPAWQQLTEAARHLPGGQRIPVDVLERFRRGLQAFGDRAANVVGTLFGASKYRIEVNPILEGLQGGFRVGDRVYSYREVRNIAVQEGVFASFDTRQLSKVINREGTLFINQQITAAGLAGAGQGAATALTAATPKSRLLNFLSDWEETVANTAEAWGERERLGAMVSLMEAGHDPRTAARVTIDALYDYSQSMTKADRSILVSVLFPFWAFQKNANTQVYNLMFSPWGAYRMMVLRRARARGTELLSELWYNEVGTEYGVDVNSMPPELQDSYYSIVSEFNAAYGGNPPPEAKRALRLLLTGRGTGVEEGKLVELSPELLQIRNAGGFADVGRFAEYAQLEPSAANRPSYMRDRLGIALPFSRSEAVRMYYRLAGDNHSYMELFIPESSTEAGLKHITQLLAAYVLIGSYPVDMLTGGKLSAEGFGEVKLKRVVEPLVDPAKSPVIGPLLAGSSADIMAPKRVAKALEAPAVALTQVHPSIGKWLDDTFGTTFIRVPAVGDPFVVNADTGRMEVSAEEVQRIKALQKEYPDVGVLKEQRYYIPGGFWSVAFENSPIGELNALLLKWEKQPLERANTEGEVLRWARAAAGFDVDVTSAQKTLSREEPTKLKETKSM